MTPEEMKRTMEFIVEHQARFFAAFEEERAERLEQWNRDQPRIAQVEAAIVRLDATILRLDANTAKLDANLLRLTELAEIQSRRLDRHDRDIHVSTTLREESQREAQRRHQEILFELHRILERLPEGKN
jgi:hypothetical protein